MTTGGFSLTKENMGEGGQALPVGDLQITESSFVPWNFDGKAPMSIYLRWVFIGADGIPSQAQYYRVGDTQRWGVAADYNSLVPVNPDDTKLPKTSGCGQALSALEDIGFPLALLDQGLASNFVGVYARFVAEKRLSQQEETPAEGTRGPGLLTIPKLLHSYPGQGVVAPAPTMAPALGPSPILAPASPVAPVVAAAPVLAAPVAVAPAPVAAPVASPVAPVVPIMAAPTPVAPAVAAPVAASVPPTPPPPSQELLVDGLTLLRDFIANKPSVKRADLSTEVFSNSKYADRGTTQRNELAALMHTQSFADALVVNGYALNGDVITVASAAPAPA